MPVKVREVARSLSLSPATVSKVVGGRAKDISTATAARVLNYCRSNGFMTEAEAAHILFRMKTGSSRKQVFAVTHSGGIEGYDAVFKGICKQMQHNGLFASLYVASNKEAVEHFPYNVAGTSIIIGPTASELVKVFEGRKIPVVLVDNRLPEVSSVNSNNLEGTSESVELLFRLGHRRIAFVCLHQGTPALDYTFRQRQNGYVAGMANVGLAINKELLIVDHVTPYLWDEPRERGRFTQDLQKLAKRLLNLKKPPTAVVATNDAMAYGLRDILRAEGLKVPEDISIVGYDGWHRTLGTNVNGFEAMSTRVVKWFEMGQEAGKLALDLFVEPGQMPKCVEVLTEYEDAGTVAPPGTSKG